ncbi:MAG TPA: dihydrodipicolinate synthase family protein, partial [Pyrinomonadaceae bacterium]|nr:dihydrodipicolinate synthase family protein [Pyrinomonadaceae bacterium]
MRETVFCDPTKARQGSTSMNGSRIIAAPDEFRARLSGGLIAATPVPFDSRGKLHEGAHDSYLRYMARAEIAGVAVWAHTGRGLLLGAETRRRVLRDWRAALPEKVVVAGVGAPLGVTPAEATGHTVEMAEAAAREGADALLVYPPTWLREHPSRDELIVSHH